MTNIPATEGARPIPLRICTSNESSGHKESPNDRERRRQR
jgi:hypothetical protein